jgi:hypothetical protein
MRDNRTAAVLAALGAALAALGAALPLAAAYVIGVLLCGGALALALRGRTPVWAGALAAVALVAVAVGAPLATAPRTDGLSGDWATRAIDGELLSGRALVSDDNASIDLRSGKTVRLGSVSGGSRWVADDRMLVVRDDRVDSVRLDATARWTWRPAQASAIRPLAAAAGSTVLRVCPLSRSSGGDGGSGGDGASADVPGCEVVGIDSKGQRAWATDAPGQSASSAAHTGRAGSLPRVAVLQAPGSGGYFLVDPGTGRRTLVPGEAALPLADGPVAIAHASAGRCVTSLYAGLSPEWTSVGSGGCARPAPTAWFASGGQLWVERNGAWERYALLGGAREGVAADAVPDPQRTSRLIISERRVSFRVNPFRSTDRATVLTLRDAVSGRDVARLVTEHRLDLLLAEDRAVVVREDDQVVRYTLNTT